MITEFNTTSQEKFTKIANKLLNSTFLLKEKNRDDYAFVSQNTKIFEDVFLNLGYEIKIYSSYEIIQLKNKFEEGNRFKLLKVHSIILLLLRVLYLEKKNETRDSSDIWVTVGNLRDKFGILNLEYKKNNNLDTQTIRETLRIFKKYSLIDFDSKLNNQKDIEDVPIRIYHTICLALMNDDIESILKDSKKLLIDYFKGGDENDETDED